LAVKVVLNTSCTAYGMGFIQNFSIPRRRTASA
jgi:hypothetical protein